MAMPAQYEHCVTVYNKMKEDASPRDNDGEEVLVWEGHLTKLFEELGLPQPYYTFVMHKLQVMGCAVKLKRGGGGGNSEWAVLDEPTEDMFNSTPERFRGTPSVADQRAQQMRDIRQALIALNADVDSKIETINLRLDMLQGQVEMLAEDVRRVNARFNP